jgi:hypothetical protein
MLTNIQPPASQIGRWAIFGTLGCQIETYQHWRGLKYGSTGCAGGSASFLGEKIPNLDENIRNEETMAWEWAETQVLGKRRISFHKIQQGTQGITS